MQVHCADKRRGLRALRSVLLANLFLVPALPAFAEGELPSGGQVVAGSGTIGAAGNALTVTQSSSRAIINWQNFSIGSGNSVQINNGSGATLNRVISNTPSTIAGSLSATGSAYLINQNGIVVTPTGKVVTGGSFIGSTRDTGDNAFMQGQAPRFTGSSSGTVINQGKIVSTGGDVVLVGKSVNNSGSVSARNGTAALVAGDDVTLQPSDSGLQIKVTAGSGDATNSGTVEAAQAMLNAAGGNVYALAGNNGGAIRATGTSVIGGRVWLTAGGQATIAGAVSAQNGDGSGGAIAVTGGDIDLSGSLDVSALSPVGSGGSANVIATGSTKVTGAIKARAGNFGGNGGSIETSGNILNIGGAAIDASAPAGLAGTWLLDPYNLTIGAAPTNATESPTGSWTSNAGGGLVLNTDINNALNAGTSVVLQTSGTLGDGFGNGDITVAAPIQMTGLSNASLTLKAASSIDILQEISSTGGALSVILNANTLGGGGYVNIGSAITTNGGDLVVGGGATPLTMAAVGTAAQVNGVLVNGAINTAGGAITINGTGYGGSVNGNSNNGVSIAAAINAGGGAISITGTGGNSSGINNIGVNQTAAITTTGTGSITLNGTGAGSGTGESGYQTTANITAGTGNISITGVSSATGTLNSNRGVGILSGTVSTAGAGTITVVGTALGSGAGASAVSANGTVTAVDGLISITGTNNSTSAAASNNGVNVTGATAVIRSTGTGGITLLGKGGGSGASGNNAGVTWNSGGIIQSTGGGAISITGTGGGNGTGSSNFGVAVLGALTGSGAISITGTGGASNGTGNFGVNISQAITGGGGAISITGTGGSGSGNQNYGIFQSGAPAAISNTGTGSITLNGTGGGTANNEDGYLLNPGASIVAGTGNISITGKGSSTATTGAGMFLNGAALSTGGAGTITFAGTGYGTLTAARMNAVSILMPNITAVNGLISITGTNNTLGTIDGNMGVHLDVNARVISTGTGGVSVTGFGGGSGTSFNDYGVVMNAANTVQSTGSGGITITGTGGDNGGSGVNNVGVNIASVAVATLSANGGAISITGTGGNSSGAGNFGINQLSSISNTGAGSITLNGTGGGSGSNERGYFTTKNVTAGTGNISITGSGSAAATGSSSGIVFSGSAISTGGVGTITLVGTGTGIGASGGSHGVDLGNGTVTAVDGLVKVTGTSSFAGTGGTNRGVNFAGAGNLKTTGTGGVTVIGFGGGSGTSSGNTGVSLGAPNAIQATGGGAISITGTGGDNGGTGLSNVGVSVGGALGGGGGALSIIGTAGNSSGSDNYGIAQSAAISNSGAGSITLNGTGGGSGTRERGYASFGAGNITAGTGDISITGAASLAATGDGNDGIGISNASISTGGAGKITLVGTATGNGPGSGGGDAGVSILSSSITAANGLISITGTNNSTGTGQGHSGVYASSGGPGMVINAGSGGVTITGFGGGTGAGGFDFGVLVANIQTSNGGAVTITGTGGDNGGSGDNNHGVFVSHTVAIQSITGSGGAISITGTGGNSSGNVNDGIYLTSAITSTGTGGINLTATPGAAGNPAITLLTLELDAGAGAVTLNSSGTVSGGGFITAAGLNLLGSGTYTLNNNSNVTTIAANTGSVDYQQGGDLTVGTVGATTGITASGTVKLASNTGNLTIANGAGVTAWGIGNALILEAGAFTLQPTVTGGDFINNAGAAALNTPNGYWLVYSGHNAGSGTVDGGLAYTAQYHVDASMAPPPPTANFMFFRAGPPVTLVTASLVGPVIKTYDGTMVAPLSATNFGLSGVNPGDQGSVVLTVNGTPIFLPTYGLFSTRNVGGNLLVTVSGLGLDQSASTTYQLTSTTISANVGTINPALLTISAQYDTRTYDGTTSSSVTPLYFGLQSGDSLSGLSQSFMSRNANLSAPLMVDGYLLNDGNGGNNYTVQTNISDGRIYPALLTVSAVSDTKVYDGTTDSSGTPTYGGLMTGDSLIGLKQVFISRNVMGTNGSILVPDFTLDDGNGGRNYNQSLIIAVGTITPAQLTVSAVSDTKVYDGTTASSATPTVTGLVSGDGLIVSQAFTSKDVKGTNGSLLVADYFLTDGGVNYVVSTNTALGTITPAPLVYVADPASKIYGKGVANGSLTGSVGGIQTGDSQGSVVTGNLKFKTLATGSSNVGSYAINGSGLTVINANYQSLIGQDGANATALTITPAQLTYKADKASRTYGAANPVFTGTVTGFVLGQSQASATTGALLFTTTADIASDVGKYPIYGSGLTANFGNYYFVQAAGNETALTIKPATLTYNANAASRARGTANPDFTGTVTGFVLGQDLDSATTGTLKFNSPANKKSSPGNYEIKGSGLEANKGNYKFVQAAGNATALAVVP